MARLSKAYHREDPCRYRPRCGSICSDAVTGAKSSELASLDCFMANRRKDLIRFIILGVLVALVGGAIAYQTSTSIGFAALKEASERRLAQQASILEREIDRFGLLPLSASLNRDVIDALKHPGDQSRIEDINHYLMTLNDSVGALQTYLVDPTGHIIASSNHGGPDSFIGRDISYRPYFQKAQPGRAEGYYGVGTTGNTAGYFLATAVEAEGRRLGVVAVKIGLEQLESRWSGAGQPVFLSDDNGVVVLASAPEWRYGVMGPLSQEDARRFDDSQRYNRRPLHSLGWVELRQFGEGAALVRVGAGATRRDYFVTSNALPNLSMRLTVLADPSNIFQLAWARAISVAVAIGFAASIVNILNQRRINTRDLLAARKALQEAHDRLEEKVETRSAELRAANTSLQREVEERTQAVKQLKSFQNELIRTENLAVIGQLSAGLAHEMNQPLAALSTLSANAVRFLENDDLAIVKSNLTRICDLVARLGALTGQLRSFARRSTGESGVVAILGAVDNAVALLEHRLTKDGVVLELRPPQNPLKASCEVVRLEQVLVNLISNAIDATAGRPVRRILLQWRQQNDRVLIEVADNGAGLTAEVLERLFEPFFTTKTTSGLGLGLAISADIIKGFGGRLSGDDRPEGGALFTIDLPVARDQG
jgi:two-component system C4-dicarboxylate transport sensor histidine kinase DctB